MTLEDNIMNAQGRFFRAILIVGTTSVCSLTAMPAAAITFLGWREDPGENGSGVQIGGWSSDYGAQAWRVPANGVDGINFLEFPASTVWEPGTDVTSETIVMDLFRQDFGSPTNRWQPVRAHAEIEIGPGGAVSPAIVHSFESNGGTAPGSGLNARAYQRGRFAFSGVSPLTPLYWGVEWTLTFNNPTNQPWIYMDVIMAANAVRNDPLLPNYNMTTTTMSGS